MAQETQRGRVIGGRYRLVKTLYTGGFGRVWLAHDERLHDDVAVKEVWLPPAVSDAERADRLTRAAREARNAAQLRHHPNIVTVRDVVAEDDKPWIVMQLVTGHSLAEDLTAAGPLSAAQVVYVADCLLKALAAAHAAGIVHRDVKPANVMFTDGGEVLLTDFGIAARETDTALTASGMLVGSMDYIAPERIHGRDSRAVGDLFSLGVTLYQAVTGVSPFRRDTVAASLGAILFDKPAPPRCQPALSALIMRLLAKDPAQRPTVAQARALLAAIPTTATHPAPPPTMPKPPVSQPKATASPKPAPPKPAPPKPAPAKPAPAKLRSAKPPRVATKRAVAVPFTPKRPTRIAPVAAAFGPPTRRRRPVPPPVARPPRRRVRRGPGISVALVLALGFIGAHAAWGRDAGAATTGDCVYRSQQDWRMEPCALPVPWRYTGSYKVLRRVDGTPEDCASAPGWTEGDHAAVLPRSPSVTLCLAPVH